MSTHEALVPGGNEADVPGGRSRAWQRSPRAHGATAWQRSRLLSFPVMTDVERLAADSGVQSFRLQDNTTEAQPEVGPAPGAACKRPLALRFGIPAALVATDLVAFAAAVALTSSFGEKTLALLLIIMTLFWTAGLYRARLSLSALDDAPGIVGRALAAGAAAMVLGGLDDGVAGTARLATSAVFGALCLVTRPLAYAGIRTARRRGKLQQTTLLLGAGTLAGSLAANLVSHPEYGLRPVGMLDDEPLLKEDERAVPVLGGYRDLTRVLTEHRADVVIVTFGSVREPSMVPLLRACDRLTCGSLSVMDARAASLTSQTCTRAPSRTKLRVISTPIPLAPAVTSTREFWRSRFMVFFRAVRMRLSRRRPGCGPWSGASRGLRPAWRHRGTIRSECA